MVEESAVHAQRLLSRKTLHAMGGGLNEHAASQGAHGDFGARMLAKFGWKAGEGLGKNKDGMAEHIRVKQRAQGLGLGASDKPPSEWAPPPSCRAPDSRDDSNDSDGSDDSDDEAERLVKQRISSAGVIPGLSDEDLFKACGGARLGMRARATQGGKLRRMEEADRALLDKLSGMAPAPAAVAAATPSVGSPSGTAGASSSLPKANKRKRVHTTAAGDAGSPGAATGSEGGDGRPSAEAVAAALAKAARKAARKAERRAARKQEKKAAKKAAKV